MKHRNFYQIVCAIALVLLLTLFACSPVEGGAETTPSGEGTTSAHTSAPESNGTPAPDITVLNSDGEEVKLSDFFGKPIVLNFWASWCPPCKAELPDFDEACKAYEGKVTFLMINPTVSGRPWRWPRASLKKRATPSPCILTPNTRPPTSTASAPFPRRFSWMRMETWWRKPPV